MNSTHEVAVLIVNAFVDGDAGGNPAGVVLGGERFTRAQKQDLAARVGLSETAFVSPSDSAAFKLEFFTPTRQIAHCGHATVATFSILHQQGLIGEGSTSKETVDGLRSILISNGMTFMEQRAPADTEFDKANLPELLASLRLEQGDLLPRQPPVVVNTGASFLLLPLADANAVRKAAPQQARIAALSERLDLIGYYVFSMQPEVTGRHAGARMFAPRYGIPEEAATGMAGGTLACLLHDRFGVGGDASILIEQGWLMPQPSPSVIEVRLDVRDGRFGGLMAGGRARLVETRTVSLG